MASDRIYPIGGIIHLDSGEHIHYRGMAAEGDRVVYEFRDFEPSSYAPNGGRMWFVDQRAVAFDELPHGSTLVAELVRRA